jgi:hypothetical protein
MAEQQDEVYPRGAATLAGVLDRARHRRERHLFASAVMSS